MYQSGKPFLLSELNLSVFLERFGPKFVECDFKHLIKTRFVCADLHVIKIVKRASKRICIFIYFCTDRPEKAYYLICNIAFKRILNNNKRIFRDLLHSDKENFSVITTK